MGNRHGDDQRRLVWPPSPGLFRVRQAKSAWKVPAQIVEDEAGWHAIVDGVPYESNADPALAERVAEVWLGEIITETDYRWLLAIKADALERNEKDHPSLRP